MKKLIVLGIIATMVMGMAVAASAAVDNAWVVQLRAIDNAGLSQGTGTYGTKATGRDEYLPPTEDSGLGLQVGTAAYVASVIGTNLCSKDYRAPLVAGQTKVWDIRIWLPVGELGPTSGKITLIGWTAASANQINPSTGGDPDLKVKLMQGDTVLWDFAQNVSGNQDAPLFSLDFVCVDSTPINLQLVASTIVPEPGSMVALFSGLVGLVGFGIRRRK